MTVITPLTDEACIQTNRLATYAELSCLYPWLRPFYTNFEATYDPTPVFGWMQEHNFVPIIAVALYGIFIVFGREYMSTRESFRVRKVLALWNLFLSVFSFIGMLRTAPNLVHNLATLSLRDNLCLDPVTTYGSGSTGLWTVLFVLSKFPELFDTLFIVINKKPLIFLHWYHHITVLLYCWHSYVTQSPAGIFFVVMNFSVHASMYFYYFLAAIRMKPKWLNPIFITTFQISQMIVGVAVTALAFYFYSYESECRIQKENNVAAFIMYGSYLLLFLQFFVGRYFKVTTGASKKKKL